MKKIIFGTFAVLILGFNSLNAFGFDEKVWYVNPKVYFDSFFDDVNKNSFYPNMNFYEKKDHYALVFELPGMSKDDIKVTINKDNMLTISGNKKTFTKEEKEGMIKQESFSGSFNRSVKLPKNSDTKDINVKYDNGLLKININKLDESEIPNPNIVLPIN